MFLPSTYHQGLVQLYNSKRENVNQMENPPPPPGISALPVVNACVSAVPDQVHTLGVLPPPLEERQR